MPLKEPILFVNFKTYDEASGENALKLAREAEQLSKQTKKTIALVVQALDLKEIARSVKIPIFAQHVDPIDAGSNTGKIYPQAVRNAGATGTVLNHAENKLSNEILEKSIAKAKEVGLLVMVCAETVERAKQIASFSTKPDYIAIEPPELIGGNVSVSSAKPEIIVDTVKAVHAIAQIPIITGAGIKNGADVRKAIGLGTMGVFVASGIVKAPEPKKAVLELLDGF
ncbi:MAG: triose-phosphate isomerase [Candidatus Diapherotrites archaeon]